MSYALFKKNILDSTKYFKIFSSFLKIDMKQQSEYLTIYKLYFFILENIKKEVLIKICSKSIKKLQYICCYCW